MAVVRILGSLKMGEPNFSMHFHSISQPGFSAVTKNLGTYSHHAMKKSAHDHLSFSCCSPDRLRLLAYFAMRLPLQWLYVSPGGRLLRYG